MKKPNQKVLMVGLKRFHENFKNGNLVYLEDSIIWFCLDLGIKRYLNLNIHERINEKQFYRNYPEIIIGREMPF